MILHQILYILLSACWASLFMHTCVCPLPRPLIASGVPMAPRFRFMAVAIDIMRGCGPSNKNASTVTAKED